MTTQDAFVDDNNRLIAAPTPRWMHSPKRIRVLFNGQSCGFTDCDAAALLAAAGLQEFTADKAFEEPVKVFRYLPR